MCAIPFSILIIPLVFSFYPYYYDYPCFALLLLFPFFDDVFKFVCALILAARKFITPWFFFYKKNPPCGRKL